MTLVVTEEFEPIYSLYMPANENGWRTIYHAAQYNRLLETVSPRGNSSTIIFPDGKELGSLLDIYRPSNCDVPFI